MNKIYNQLPVVLQEYAISFYAKKRNLKYRYNSFYFESLIELKKLERNSELLIDYQLKHLNDIIEYSLKHVLYYKNQEIYLNNSFKNFPIINKQVVKENFNAFLTDDAHVLKKSMKNNTSGSTGTSMNLFLTPKTTGIERADINAFRARSGYQYGDSVASFIGRKIMDFNQNEPPFWRYNKVDNQLIFSYWHLSIKTISSYIEKLIEFKPKFIHGYPSFIMLIAEYILNKKITINKVDAIFTSSENLMTHQRQVIEKAFKTKVFDRYGSAEMLISASQCEFGQYHVNPMLGYLEIIDNHIIGTTFHNYAMPLIRYDMGDISEFELSKCECGRITPIIRKPDGRLEDVVVSKDGKKFGRLDHLFKNVPDLIECQIIQEDFEHLTIKAKSHSPYNVLEKSIKKAVFDKLGNTFSIKVEKVKEIERAKSGKLRFVISKIQKK